jgi:hypothetical protein
VIGFDANKGVVKMLYKTRYAMRCKILATLIEEYGQDIEFQNFIVENCIGLSLSYAIHHEIVQSSKEAKVYVDETFDSLANWLGLDPYSREWWNLDDILEDSLNLENES